jgi:biuret amidohydrolase
MAQVLSRGFGVIVVRILPGEGYPRFLREEVCAVVDFEVSPDRTALVNVDLQNFFVDSTGDGVALVDKVNELANACRGVGILVIHTAHILRPDGSNVGVLGEIVPGIEETLSKGAKTAEFHPRLRIEPTDVIVEKPRFGAFYGTDLESILRSRGLDTIIISGIATDVCCDTTAREANARDFRVLFLSDGTATNGEGAEEAQRATLEMMGSLFAEVLSLEEVLAKVMAGRADVMPGLTDPRR